MSRFFNPKQQQRLLSYARQVSDVPTVPQSDFFEVQNDVLTVPPEGEEGPVGTLESTPVSPPPARVDDIARIISEKYSTTSYEESVAEVYVPSLPAFTGNVDQMIETAQRAQEKIENGQLLDADEFDSYEAVILPSQRPVVNVIGGTFDTPLYPFAFLGEPPYRDLIEKALASVGRIELPFDPLRPFGGTGFFIGDGLLLTNRHVALLFSGDCGHPGSRTINYRPEAAKLDMKKEVVTAGTPEPAPLLLKVRDVLLIHPYWDAAILSVEAAKGQILPPPLTLARARPKGPLGERYVATIGYPQKNPNSNIEVQEKVFNSIYGRKRLMPGRLGMVAGDTRREFSDYTPCDRPGVEALTHDCSTLTGNSGSAVLDLATGMVLGLHFAGKYLVTNYAVPTWELARDRYIKDLPINFASPEDGETNEETPPWENYWSRYPNRGTTVTVPVAKPVAASVPEQVGVSAVEPVIAPAIEQTPTPVPEPVTPPAPAPRVSTATTWYEQTDDAGIAAALKIDPEGTARSLYEVLPPNEAAELIQDLAFRPTGEESVEASEGLEESFLSDLFERKADPNLPEIILLHGILGGHLTRATGIGGRLWVNPLAFIAGGLAAKLSLAADGVSELTPGQVVRADGPIRLAYAQAARTLRKSGFVVHEFSYDWRKPIDLLADSLDRYIEERALQSPGKKFALVAHSMGGVVSALYAARHKNWRKRIAGSVFLGSPLQGSFAPMQAVLGTADMIDKLAAVTRGDHRVDFQKMACSLPGLLDMLPDPTLFPKAELLYSSSGWPDPALCPSEELLQHSRQIKTDAVASPLLEETFMIVAQRHPTVGNLFGVKNVRGDGTVPLKSAAAFSAPRVKGRFLAQSQHGNLPSEVAVLTAVAQLLRTGTCALPVLDEATLADDSLPTEEAAVSEEESTPIREADISAIRARFQAGAFTHNDWQWLTQTL